MLWKRDINSGIPAVVSIVYILVSNAAMNTRMQLTRLGSITVPILILFSMLHGKYQKCTLHRLPSKSFGHLPRIIPTELKCQGTQMALLCSDISRTEFFLIVWHLFSLYRNQYRISKTNFITHVNTTWLYWWFGGWWYIELNHIKAAYKNATLGRRHHCRVGNIVAALSGLHDVGVDHLDCRRGLHGDCSG